MGKANSSGPGVGKGANHQTSKKRGATVLDYGQAIVDRARSKANIKVFVKPPASSLKHELGEGLRVHNILEYNVGPALGFPTSSF